MGRTAMRSSASCKVIKNKLVKIMIILDWTRSYLIVNELDVVPVDRLVVVFLLFQLEDMLDEELLEIFVGIVDAELLEGVAVKVFEAENVQDADGVSFMCCPLVRSEDRRIDFLDNVDEQSAVDSFGKRIPDILALVCVQG